MFIFSNVFLTLVFFYPVLSGIIPGCVILSLLCVNHVYVTCCMCAMLFQENKTQACAEEEPAEEPPYHDAPQSLRWSSEEDGPVGGG